MSGQAHGLRGWLLQRVTAVYLGCYVAYLMVHFFLQPSHGYEQWHAWISQPLVAIVSAGFIFAMLLHGWIGMRDIVFDYIQQFSAEIANMLYIQMLLQFRPHIFNYKRLKF